ncbi:MAG: sigma-54-dependent transcriptional regulator [Saprospiraceae bacterium]
MLTELTDTHRNKILIVDDQVEFHIDIRKSAPFRQHYDFGRADDVPQLMQVLASGEQFDLVLLDLVFDEVSGEKVGLTLIPTIKDYLPNVPIIVATNHGGDVSVIVQATKLGADDFLYKSDYDPIFWEKKISEIIKKRGLEERNQTLERELRTTQARLREVDYEQPPGMPFIGVSKKIEGIRKMLKAVANEPDMKVLILGETGVGKGVAAQFLHYNNHARRDKPFEEIHISTISASLLESTLFGAMKGTYTGAVTDQKGRLEMANGGTVFLDEIGELTSENQIKLLQFLQSKTIRPIGGSKDILLDVQIVTATNKVLRDEVAKGNFREDLYQRINVFQIEVPPLRERRDDIEPLLLYFLKKTSIAELDGLLDPAVKRILIEECPWPGNVRQLENTLKRMNAHRLVYGIDHITMECVPSEIFDSPAYAGPISSAAQTVTPGRSTSNSERPIKEKNARNVLEEIEHLLEKKNGVKNDVATALGLSTSTLVQYRIKELHKKYPHLITIADFPEIRKHYYKLFN